MCWSSKKHCCSTSTAVGRQIKDQSTGLGFIGRNLEKTAQPLAVLWLRYNYSVGWLVGSRLHFHSGSASTRSITKADAPPPPAVGCAQSKKSQRCRQTLQRAAQRSTAGSSPLQMAATPTRALLQRNTLSSVTTRRVPLAPRGCPRATAPPKTLTLCGGEQQRRRRRQRSERDSTSSSSSSSNGRSPAQLRENPACSCCGRFGSFLPVRVQPQQLPVGEVHDREGFVHLKVIHLADVQACSRDGDTRM